LALEIGDSFSGRGAVHNGKTFPLPAE